MWIGIVKLSLLRTGYFSSAANVLRSSPKIWHVNKRDFFKFNWPLQYSMNMIKMLWCRFQQCLGTSPMLLVQGSSETGLFILLSNHNIGVRNFGNTKAMRVTFFKKCLNFKLISKMEQKIWKTCFVSEINSIWIGIDKLSLLRTGYFSTATNVLRSSPKILQVNKRDFCQLNWLCSDHWI